VADVRVICATNRDLRKEVEAGRFREDLFYRLTVFPIELPPLRARREDIRPLAQHFLKQSAAKLGLRAPKLTVEQATQLEQYDWPGNVRELENVIERATILARGSGRLHFDLPRTRPRRETAAPPPAVLKREDLARQEIDNILAALEQSGGRVFGRGGAAELLGMKPTTLASRLKALGIRRQFSIAREEPPQ
jgi:transcriptional regulator with GAF, ATPase, and Fis domain